MPLLLTRLSQAYSTPWQKWRPLGVEEAGPADVAVETEEIGEVGVEAASSPRTLSSLLLPLLHQGRSIRGPSTLTCPQETGMDVESIINTGKMLIFVQNQQVVLGRMYLDREIETVTSSVNNTSCLMTH